MKPDCLFVKPGCLYEAKHLHTHQAYVWRADITSGPVTCTLGLSVKGLVMVIKELNTARGKWRQFVVLCSYGVTLTNEFELSLMERVK